MSANPPADAQFASDLKAVVDAELSGQPFLVYRDGQDRQQLYLFASGAQSASVGRRPASDLVLAWDDQVSRLHARFEQLQGAWELVDDGFSSNGTFVNEERLHGRRPLHDGDALRFGATTVTFRSPERRPSPVQNAPAAPPPVDLSTNQRRILAALCRPYGGRGGFASPATDEQIAEELFLSVGEVRAHLRVLFVKLGVAGPSEAETRVRAVELALSSGLITERDL